MFVYLHKSLKSISKWKVLYISDGCTSFKTLKQNSKKFRVAKKYKITLQTSQ